MEIVPWYFKYERHKLTDLLSPLDGCLVYFQRTLYSWPNRYFHILYILRYGQLFRAVILSIIEACQPLQKFEKLKFGLFLTLFTELVSVKARI